MIPALLFAVIIIASAVVTVFYKSFIALPPRKSDFMMMMFAATAPPAVLYAVMCGVSGFEFTLTTVITALAGAVLNVVTIGTFLKAMASGSFTLSVIIINLNFCIPILLSVICLRERASVLQLVGIAILVAVIIVTNLADKSAEKTQDDARTAKEEPESVAEAAATSALQESEIAAEQTQTNKAAHIRKNAVFLGLAVLACVGNGVLNFVIKLQQHYTPGSGENTFYFIMYGTVCVICGVGYLVTRAAQRNKTTPRHEKKSVLLGLCVGACTVASQYPQTFLARYVSAAVEFTVIAALAVLLSIAIGFIKYKEKPTVRNICSAVCCLAAIILQVLT